MSNSRNLQKELEELGVLWITDTESLTERDIFAAFDAIRENDCHRDEAAELQYIKELQRQRRDKGMNKFPKNYHFFKKICSVYGILYR
jgi:hypothetical protein